MNKTRGGFDRFGRARSFHLIDEGRWGRGRDEFVDLFHGQGGFFGDRSEHNTTLSPRQTTRVDVHVVHLRDDGVGNLLFLITKLFELRTKSTLLVV